MNSEAVASESRRVLSGWKEIANYLGSGVRTVQRYEREFALPVRRPAAKARGAVMARPADLDQWLAASSRRKEFRRGRVPQVRSDSTLVILKQSMSEMHRLRQQVAQVQAEVKTSVETLHRLIPNIGGQPPER